MHVIRRFYFYLVAFISLEVVIWGTILLARTLISPLPISSVSTLLAGGLSLVLVGLPIFLLHWITAQRDALRTEEERSTHVRAIFLYGARLAVLIPVAQNVLAILDRALLQLMNAQVGAAFVGGGQSLADNLVAISVNLVAWAYLERVLRSDREAWLQGDHLDETRRLYRYIWLVYGLALTVMGTQRILNFVIASPFNHSAYPPGSWAANGIALALVGAPIWAWIWSLIRQTLAVTPAERYSPLHLAVVYGVALLSAMLTAIATAGIISSVVGWLLNANMTFAALIDLNAASLGLAIPMAALWEYFGRERRRSLRAVLDPQRRAELERLYFYVLALIGNATTFMGLWSLALALAQLVPSGAAGTAFSDRLAAALGPLLVGLPVWLITWVPLQNAALRPGRPTAARQSLVRRVYLYLVLFLTVVGAMATAGTLLYLVLSNLLGSVKLNFNSTLIQHLLELVLVLIWLGYHWNTLRGDLRAAHQAQGERFARFPVLILQADDHPFASELAGALQRESPGLPVAVHRLDLAPLTDDLAEAKVVVLPAGLAARPPEALRLWLNEYSGQRVLAPLPAGGITFVGVEPRSDRELVQQTVQAVRSLAEGRPVHVRGQFNPWVVSGAVLGGAVLLILLVGLISSLISTIG